MHENTMDCLTREAVLAALPPAHPWQDRIFCPGVVDSTNTRAKQLAASGAPHGTVVIAGAQTAGRGRLGRSFHSPEGKGVYLSVILRPGCSPAQLMHLTCAVGTAMCGGVEALSGFRPGIKWINDLVCGGKKLGGILTELGLDPRTGQVSYAVVGIGINCRHEALDFPPELREKATSLFLETGTLFDRSHLAAAMVTALSEMDAQLLPQKEALMARYRRDCVTIGQRVRVLGSGAPRPAEALDVDGSGGLVVRYDDGQIQTVTSGEVSVRGMDGYV